MTGSLDRRFVTGPSLQMVFLDKDTGLPLRSGTVSFYKDQARTDPKDVYKLSGSPGAYTYTNIGPEVTLTGIGTFSDNLGNDIIPYFFPYDGTPADSNNTIERYFAFTESGAEISQFSREAWPPGVFDDEDGSSTLINFVPNGQFLLHNNLPATTSPDHKAGEIRAAITDIAPGGWTFERPEGSTATDFVTFERYGSFTTNPTASPRYAVRLRCTDPGAGGDFKDLRIKWGDVNKFASAEQKYTFSFNGKTNAGTSVDVQLIAIKNFGAGGDATEEVVIGTITLASSAGNHVKSFVFGDNVNKTIGPDNDDFTQLAIRMPVDSIFDVTITDDVLVFGEQSLDDFPVTPNAKFIYESLAGGEPVPDYDGKELFLPIILTKTGYKTDSRVIGRVVAESAVETYTNGISPDTNLLLADGRKYERLGYSDLGIPFQRLGDKYWIDSIKTPRYGTGSGYLTGVFSGTGFELRIDTNDAKAVTDATDTSTTFTISNIAKGGVWYTKAYLVAASTFYLENLNIGVVSVAVDVSTTFTITTIRTGSALLKNISSIATIAAAGLAAPGGVGKYFNFTSYNAGVQAFYVWYQITNETDPAPGGRTGIKINLTGIEDAATVAQKTREALNGWQCTKILTVAASAIPAGSYFNIYSSTTQFYVWYKKDGVGTEPVVPGATGIQVDIAAADTNTTVATKTQETINRKYFAIPDYRGAFLRGTDNGAGVDPDAATRYSLVPGIGEDQVGTNQLDGILSHSHLYGGDVFPQDGSTTPCLTIINANQHETSYTGGKQNTVINTYVNYAIIY